MYTFGVKEQKNSVHIEKKEDPPVDPIQCVGVAFSHGNYTIARLFWRIGRWVVVLWSGWIIAGLFLCESGVIKLFFDFLCP